MSDYTEFLRQKIKLASFDGFDVSPEEINPALKPHTRDIVRWAAQGGNRLMTAEEMARMGPGKLAKFFTEDSLRRVYDHEMHVEIGDQLAQRKALPSDFMSLAPGSHSPNVWHDVVRMVTLNNDQANRAVEKHVCPLQIDIVDRLIRRYSNKGELVYDPFCGIGTVPVRALKLGRRGGGSELSAAYFADQVHYLKAMEREVSMPTLFDLDPVEEAEAA